MLAVTGMSVPSAVICEDDPVLAAALIATVSHLYGLNVAATVTSLSEAFSAADRTSPDLVVIDLALAGEFGLGVIPALHVAAPGCSVVVVVPPAFVGLQEEALAAGAVSFVESSDLRPLQCSIEHLRDVHVEACRSCIDQQRRRASMWRWDG